MLESSRISFDLKPKNIRAELLKPSKLLLPISANFRESIGAQIATLLHALLG